MNLSSKPVQSIQVRIDRSWLSYRPDAPLPQRRKGRFEMSVSVVSLEQVG